MPKSRRQFLRDLALASAGAGALPAILSQSAAAIEPIKRLGEPKFKFSLAAYSYRSLLGGKEPKLTMADFVAGCAKMQLEGTELTSYYFPADVTPEYLRKIRHQAFLLGLDVSGTAIANEFCHPKGPEREKQLQHVKTWVDRAEILGAPVIRVFSGKQNKDQSPEDAHRLAVEGMEECCDYAGRHGITLALENHGGLTTNADDMLRLVKDVQSPWFGVNLDTGNFHSEDVYGDLAKLAPYAVNVQIKVVVSSGKGSKQPADFSQLAKMMTDVGYRGYIVLEFEENEDPRVACPRHIKELRQAFVS